MNYLKVTIEDRKPKEPEVKWEYPCLGESNTYKYVVLFEEEALGTVIMEGNGCCDLAYYSNEWQMKHFTPLKNKRIIIEC